MGASIADLMGDIDIAESEVRNANAARNRAQENAEG